MSVVIELDVEVPDLASVEVETPDVELTPSSGESVLLVAVPGPPGPTGPPGQGFPVFGETPAGIRNGSNTVFGTTNPYQASTLNVYLNGLRETNCTETTSDSFTFDDPPSSDDSIVVDYVIQ